MLAALNVCSESCTLDQILLGMHFVSMLKMRFEAKEFITLINKFISEKQIK